MKTKNWPVIFYFIPDYQIRPSFLNLMVALDVEISEIFCVFQNIVVHADTICLHDRNEIVWQFWMYNRFVLHSFWTILLHSLIIYFIISFLSQQRRNQLFFLGLSMPLGLMHLFWAGVIRDFLSLFTAIYNLYLPLYNLQEVKMYL